MLNNIRSFSKTIFAKILLIIIIIPFVFWGMGGVFSGGNTNSVAKINNHNISTQDFFDYLNSSNIKNEYIKKNIDNNVIEEFLAKFISKNMLNLEIKDLNLIITDKTLKNKIKNNKNFKDANNNFSRIKYEKFLLTSGLSAPAFEIRLRENELRKNLFSYMGGGVESPFFLINNFYKDQTKRLTIEYLNLENIYKKREDFNNKEILDFIEENKEQLKEEKITFHYTKITPFNLTGENEYSNDFFKKIDEIESAIVDGINFENIIKNYSLKTEIRENFDKNKLLNSNKNENIYLSKILSNSNKDKIVLLDENEFYILYEIKNIKKELPSIKNKKFIDEIKNAIFNKEKFKFNRDLIKKITEKKFTKNDFNKISKKYSIDIKKTEISSIKDDKKFTIESIKFLYTLNNNDLTLINDKNNLIYLTSINNFTQKNISKNSKEFKDFQKQTDIKIRDQIYASFDFFLNSKYKVKINEKTLERVKNYFR